jgi:hypothetical protein
MTIAIRLSTSLVEEAKKYALLNLRTIPKQIEYWSLIGRIADENPDLPLSFIKETLIGLDEVKQGKVTPFIFRGE